jgi:hypothetical protein
MRFHTTLFNALLCVALLAATSSAQNLIYSSEMTSSTGWVQSDFGFGTSSAIWDFDYSAFGIPEAPNTDSSDASARGVRLAANVGASFGGDQISVSYRDAAFTGQYTFQVDAWLNWSADVDLNGTTEHAGVYAGFDPTTADGDFPAQSGAGLLWSSDGDCGNCDYILAKNGVGAGDGELDLLSGQYSVSDFGFGNQSGYDNTDVNADPLNGELIDIPAIFPEFDIAAATNNMNGSGTQRAGAAGFQWVTITAEVDTAAMGTGNVNVAGLASFTIANAATGDELFVGTIDNSSDLNPGGEVSVDMSGGIGLMLVDFFSSNASDPNFAFVVYDNVRVYDGFLTSGPDGDFNDDTIYDCSDIDSLVADIAAGNNTAAFDLTGDGNVDGADLDAWLAEAGALFNASGNPFLPGDANLDGFVNGQDFVIWNNNKFTANAAWCSGDFNADGQVNGQDFVTWNTFKFQASDVAAVPEPTFGLFVLASGLLMLRRRS